MNKLLAIVFAGLFASVTSCSGERMKFLENFFNETVNDAFFNVKRTNCSESCIRHLQNVVQIHTEIQNRLSIETNIQLPSLVAETDSRGRTLLDWSATGNKSNVMEWLLAQGASVYTKDEEGFTPLHSAARYDADETVPLLLTTGADINAQTKDGWAPLHWSSLNNAGRANLQLLNADADVHARDHTGKTPLHWSSWANADTTTKQLLNKDANVHARDNVGKMPLHYSAYTGAVTTTLQLFGQGAKVNARDNAGKTPSDYASSNEMRQLLKNHQNKQAATTMQATWRGYKIRKPETKIDRKGTKRKCEEI